MRTLLCVGLLALLVPLTQKGEVSAKACTDLMLRYAASGWSGSVLVAKDGKELFAGGYGFADFAADRANSADTLFEIASITKSFTAAAVVKLVQQGKLSLDDSIAKLLPGVPEHSRTITLRHLLSHTSGIPRGNTSGSGENLEMAVVAFLGSGPQSKPGAKYEYWNGGYALLAGVIERASARSYTQSMEEELFAPAHMLDSGFTGDTDLDVAREALGAGRDGHDRRAVEHPYRSYGYEYRGMGGLVTTARDLLKWDRALAGNALLDETHKRVLFETVKDGYALGWRITRVANGSLRQSHGGAVRGFVSEFRRYPAEGACIVVLCNQETHNPGEVADNLESLLFGRALATPAPKVELMTKAQLEACAGTYGNAADQLVVRVAPGVLMAGLAGEKLLAAAGVSEKLDWKVDPAELSQRAVSMIEGLARGDVELLREHIAKRIPPSWPDTMLRSIWPKQLTAHGAFKSVRALASLPRAGQFQVLLAIEHERSNRPALLAFSAQGLETFDLHAAAFFASARLQPQGKNAFLLQLGPTPARLDFELMRGKATAARLGTLKLPRQ